MKPIRTLIVTTLMAGLLPLAAIAQPAPEASAPGKMPPVQGHPHHGMGKPGGHYDGHHGANVLRGVKLTEAQENKAFNIRHAAAPAFHERMLALRKAHEELRAMSVSANYDEAAARKLADRIGATTAELTLLRLKTDRQIYDLLTPEQRKQVEDNAAKAKAPR